MLFSRETLKAYASSKGITNIDDSAYQLLSQDLEYRVKELCQDAAKFMHASHRTKLSIDDVNYALIARNIDPLFGYDPSEPLNFKNINNFFYIPDDECDIEDYLNRPLPKLPPNPSVHAHWLAIEGVQPQIPQNPLPAENKYKAQDVLHSYMEEVEIKANPRLILSKELQMYFDKINKYIEGSSKETTLALDCLENDCGIQQLIPYFIQSFSETLVSKNSTDKREIIIAMLFALLKNKFIFIDPYLHQIVPALLTGILGSNFSHSTREISSTALVYLYERFSNTYNSLAPRIINTLKKYWLDQSKCEDTQYHAVKTLSLLGKTVIDDIITKNANFYVSLSGSSLKVKKFLQSICASS
ncbi:hypothetical protein EDEG_00217 [Edhazardia aedis USNM 41457]|uniref:TATA box binding protein associated factor (TAF) histone-like fold domain-containing protein n=1 Tax=Edhazardia aedis (strain USNM 41457) TaxID=1003232 RepID=J8ZUF6_EDHAE|nr:hypothetical protein EDEG_00217 [Edhazardia aedis USNM 41457]|eukprot:EJW03308.1 hypothetical protein EDEG_00217 [Edhazardia aedis USNM 41457]